MENKNTEYEAVVQEYPEDYRPLIREAFDAAEQEYKNFIFSLIM